LELFAIPFALILTVWFTNLYNFMDGMDGFAGGMTVFGFGGCAVLAWGSGDVSLALLCSVIATSGAGFLCWNFPPAKIFMGDVAAAPLGYLVAMVTFLGVKHQSMDLWQPLIIFSPFWVDATVTLIRRLMKGDRVWEAHRTHAYQRLVNAGWGHRKTALAEYGLMATMVGVAWQYGGLGASSRLYVLGGTALLFLLLWPALRAAEKAHQKRILK
jgi:UDP-N-acetylmuramyl pentapeptide phosphotransferase/UDP-N-acetylglucosamine-1-phosphate transferase